MQSAAQQIADYLAALQQDKRHLIVALRALVLENLRPGYVENHGLGMISYEVPLERSGRTYNGKPLTYAAISAQKNHVGLHLCGLYVDQAALASFQATYAASGIPLDMGKACVRLKNEQGIERYAVAQAISAMPIDTFIAAMRR
jgi:hypothetical protein